MLSLLLSALITCVYRECYYSLRSFLFFILPLSLSPFSFPPSTSLLQVGNSQFERVGLALPSDSRVLVSVLRGHLRGHSPSLWKAYRFGGSLREGSSSCLHIYLIRHLFLIAKKFKANCSGLGLPRTSLRS